MTADVSSCNGMDEQDAHGGTANDLEGRLINQSVNRKGICGENTEEENFLWKDGC